MIGFSLGVLLCVLVSSFGAMAGDRAERQRRIQLAILRSRNAVR